MKCAVAYIHFILIMLRGTFVAGMIKPLFSLSYNKLQCEMHAMIFFFIAYQNILDKSFVNCYCKYHPCLEKSVHYLNETSELDTQKIKIR